MSLLVFMTAKLRQTAAKRPCARRGTQSASRKAVTWVENALHNMTRTKGSQRFFIAKLLAIKKCTVVIGKW